MLRTFNDLFDTLASFNTAIADFLETDITVDEKTFNSLKARYGLAYFWSGNVSYIIERIAEIIASFYPLYLKNNEVINSTIDELNNLITSDKTEFSLGNLNETGINSSIYLSNVSDRNVNRANMNPAELINHLTNSKLMNAKNFYSQFAFLFNTIYAI